MQSRYIEVVFLVVLFLGLTFSLLAMMFGLVFSDQEIGVSGFAGFIVASIHLMLLDI